MNEEQAAEILEKMLEKHGYWSKDFEALELAIMNLRRAACDRLLDIVEDRT